MNAPSTTAATRTIEVEMEIAAPVEAVWKALTDAEELARWFPMRAEVKPGVGGWIRSWWGQDYAFQSWIEEWEPNKHLRELWGLPQSDEPPATGDTPADSDQSSSASPLFVDYHLEGRGQGTALRMVHTGFGHGEEWDDKYDMIQRGWAFELRGLRHYLQRHRGTPRRIAWVRRNLTIDFEEAWGRLMSPQGLLRSGTVDGLNEGDRYSVAAATGDTLAGTAHIVNRPKDFCATVEGLNDAFLHIRLDKSCETPGQSEAHFFVSTYGLSQDQVDALQERWNTLFAALYPEATTE